MGRISRGKGGPDEGSRVCQAAIRGVLLMKSRSADAAQEHAKLPPLGEARRDIERANEHGMHTLGGRQGPEQEAARPVTRERGVDELVHVAPIGGHETHHPAGREGIQTCEGGAIHGRRRSRVTRTERLPRATHRAPAHRRIRRERSSGRARPPAWPVSGGRLAAGASCLVPVCSAPSILEL